MNDGSYPKKFFTVGSISRKLVENFVRKWGLGWVERIPLELNQTPTSGFDLEGEFISLYISDSDLPSLNLLKAHIELLKNPQDIEIIILAETEHFQEQAIAWADINVRHKGLTPQVIIRESANSILECYAHFLCGFSFSCVDYQSIRHWLHAGSTYVSAGCESVPPKELPYTLYLEIKKLEKDADAKQLELAAINVVFLGDVWSFELLEAMTLMLHACMSESTAVTVHSNFQTDGQSDIGFKLFAAMKRKSEKAPDNDLPVFLKG